MNEDIDADIEIDVKNSDIIAAKNIDKKITKIKTLTNRTARKIKSKKSELQKKLDKVFDRFVLEGVKDIVMHEIGHTRGLRHNFKASNWLTLDEINNPQRSKEYRIASSVMDYLLVNIAPKGKPQGDYFMTTLGPYDYLVIEYGYTHKKNCPAVRTAKSKNLMTVENSCPVINNFSN
ncbi:MAG: zinc-dependent metalloprotease [Planctomycetaceae bacterium]|nr:zinc-dependent metalloprotease [Planctomycetaceae bacterium]